MYNVAPQQYRIIINVHSDIISSSDSRDSGEADVEGGCAASPTTLLMMAVVE